MTEYNIADEELLATIAGMDLPTISSEIALQITANRCEMSKVEAARLGAPKDKLRSHVHKRLQNLVEVGSVEKIEFHSNDRIHLYTLPQTDDEGYKLQSRVTQEKYANMVNEA